jgi:hemolysin activation/secretion protein
MGAMPVYSAISQGDQALNDVWQGTVTTPEGGKMSFGLNRYDGKLYILINNRAFKAEEVKIHADETIEFYIQITENPSSKLLFKGMVRDEKIYGSVIDITGQEGNWIVSNMTRHGLAQLAQNNWSGKITTPDGQRLDLNLKTIDNKPHLSISDNNYKIQNFEMLPGNMLVFEIVPQDNPSAVLYFSGQVMENWIIAGNVTDKFNNSGSWIVKKDLNEYGFIATDDNKLVTGAEIAVVDEDKSQQATQKQDELLLTVRAFDIDESKILTQAEINDLVAPYVNKVLQPQDIKQLIDSINEVYREKGYITAKAFLPPQTIEDGLVKITLVEGHVGEITMTDNKFTRNSYIMSRLHQKQGDLLELGKLEKDIKKFNRLHNVKLRANLSPGAELGTTNVEIVADDPNPYHLTPSFDNLGRKSIGLLRGGVLFNTDSMFGYRDQLFAGYTRAADTDLVIAGYNVPVGPWGTRLGTNFSYSNVAIDNGAFKNLNLTGNAFNYSGYLSHPFYVSERALITGDLSGNFRDSTTYVNDVKLFKTQVRSLEGGVNLQYRDRYGAWILRHAFTGGFSILGGQQDFFKYQGNVMRVQHLGHGFLAILRAATQLSPQNLPPIEQFQLGGANTVRGYNEGVLLGDNGYFVSAELRIPLPFLPETIGGVPIRDKFSGVAFVDHGAAFTPISNTYNGNNYLTSVGFGLRAALTKYLNGRVDYGFRLNKVQPNQSVGRVHFGIEANPF